MIVADTISRQAELEKQYRIDDSATLSTRDVVNVEDIEDMPSVTPTEKPTYRKKAKRWKKKYFALKTEIEKAKAEIDSHCSDNRDRNDGLYIAMKIIDKHIKEEGSDKE